jgi:hypothetical protein
MGRTAAASKPSLLLIATSALPTICPACACKDVKVEPRAGGWFKVTCQRSDIRICEWSAGYELKTVPADV